MTNISDIGAHDSYRTIAASGTSEYVDRKSRFIGQVQHVESEREAREFIDAVRATYPDARHHVYAYVLQNGRPRYSDDGEPAKTAGTPALEVLQHSGLTDLIVVVTRYFGGVLLGTGGLVLGDASHALVVPGLHGGKVPPPPRQGHDLLLGVFTFSAGGAAGDQDQHGASSLFLIKSGAHRPRCRWPKVWPLW